MMRIARVCFEIFLALGCEGLALVAAVQWLTGTAGFTWSSALGYSAVGALFGVVAVIETVEGLFAFVGSLIGPPKNM